MHFNETLNHTNSHVFTTEFKRLEIHKSVVLKLESAYINECNRFNSIIYVSRITTNLFELLSKNIKGST
jgi:hypothetical protein